VGLAGLAQSASPAKAEVGAIDKECKPVEAVWARGSGQVVTTGSDVFSDEFVRFRDQMEYRFGDTVNFYELGAESIEGYQYPAVAVGTDSWEDVGTSGDAALSGGRGGAYGASMVEGANELSLYVFYRMGNCPDAQFILGGYSQGAQVVGTAYIEGFNDEMRESVTFQMLFGDPKLYLPEGEGSWWWGGAPACRDEEFSLWRREVPDCNTDNGSLGARKPYLPESWDDTTGLWCAEDDFVCGSSKLAWEVSGHRTYPEPWGAIDDGVLEAAQKVKAKSPPDLAASIVTIPVFRSGTTGLDVVFLIDSTGSMKEEINQAKSVVSATSAMIDAFNGRVALAEYRDADDAFAARVLTDLEAGIGGFQSQLARIVVAGGGDLPEALLHALKVTMNGVSWRSGATKAVVVLSDAGYHDPDRVDGTTLADVAALSLAIDPVNVYPVVPSGVAASYADLAEATAGQVVEWRGDVAAALAEALARIEDRPVPRLPLNAYYAEPGQSIRFDGSRSYSPGSDIVKWDWDFDGDGVYEELDAQSVTRHVYDEPFEGFVQLRVTDANGLVANITAPVTVGLPAEPRPAAPQGLVATGEGSTVRLEWEAPEDPAYAWRVTVNGVQAGLIEAAARSVLVTDIPVDADTEFGVGTISAQGEVGPAAYLLYTPSAPQQPGDGNSAEPGDGSEAVGLSPGSGGADAPSANAAGARGALPVSGADSGWHATWAAMLILGGLGLAVCGRRWRLAR
jgi:Mg-chelatase subunit ChlD